MKPKPKPWTDTEWAHERELIQNAYYGCSLAMVLDGMETTLRERGMIKEDPDPIEALVKEAFMWGRSAVGTARPATVENAITVLRKKLGDTNG